MLEALRKTLLFIWAKAVLDCLSESKSRNVNVIFVSHSEELISNRDFDVEYQKNCVCKDADDFWNCCGSRRCVMNFFGLCIILRSEVHSIILTFNV